MSRNTFGADGAERLSDAELSERLGRYQRQSRAWLRIGLTGIAGGLIAAVTVHDAALKALLVAVLFGGGLWCALFLSGGARKRLKTLMQEQLGGFFCAELEKTFGPERHSPEMQIDRPLLEALRLLDGRWEACGTENFREGVCRGVRFSAANVRLEHVYERGHGQGSLGTESELVFRGLVLRCETRVPAPSAIRANARTADSPRGVMTGNAAFDRRFCVTAEREQDAPALLTPQFAAWLSAFEQSVEGTISCFCWENRVFTLALETDYGFAAVADDVDMRDLDAVRRSYQNSLREMEETIALLLKNTALFAPRD